MRLLLALILSAVLAPAASANPARDLTAGGIPGAVVLSGDRVYDSGNLDARQRFRVGSVTKTFVSAITLQLVAEGRLTLDRPVPVRGVGPGFGEGQDFTVQNTSWAGASGSLVSTARDLGRFYRALTHGPLLAAMTTLDPAAQGYGLGLYPIRTPCGTPWGHNGRVPGYYAQAYASADGRRRVVVLVNLQPLSERQEAAVQRAVVEAYCS